ncbi:hypothetical protein [Pseudomonas sp. LB3P14]
MQEVKVVEAAYVRSVMMNADIKNGLESGRFYLAVKPRKPSRHSVTQKEFEQRRRDAGFRKLQVLVPEPIFNKLRDRLHGDETLALLLERLLAETDSDQLSMVQADK